MKKIDFHIHTVPTVSDSAFEFEMECFERYVNDLEIDAVAITNHDVFDVEQYREIKDRLGAVVFPGIEVTLEKGHVLIISDDANLDAFQESATLVSQEITSDTDSISVERLFEIFGDLERYLVIPHYDKKPSVSGETLNRLLPHVSAGEVDSPKKFIRNHKDTTRLVPVLFSDLRIRSGLSTFPTRQTYLDCGEITLPAVKSCLRDRSNVALSESDGNALWQIFEDGQRISTGLNILLGERSSGKTYTLNEIESRCENAKYIKQFSLVQQDETAYEKEFNASVQKNKSGFIDNYLMGFKGVLDSVMDIDLTANEKEVESYVETLLKSAELSDRQDAFSKAALFNEEMFPEVQTEELSRLIESVRHLRENVEYKEVIEKHIQLLALEKLAVELIETLWGKLLEGKKKKLVNELVSEIQQNLRLRTSAQPIEGVDLYNVAMDKKRIEVFGKIVDLLKRDEVIYEESIQGFKVEARKTAFQGAGEIREASGVSGAFLPAYQAYEKPYEYLQKLKEHDGLARADLYKLFTSIKYRILNKDGAEVSGGERSEFRLLQEIKDAQNYDILLVDEPESSFDNPFLKSDVNQILKELSTSMPVVIVTHNSTVGASVGANYLIFTKKENEGGSTVYRRYSGYPSDTELQALDGNTIPAHGVVLDSLEAGAEAYESRREGYEAIKS